MHGTGVRRALGERGDGLASGDPRLPLVAADVGAQLRGHRREMPSREGCTRGSGRTWSDRERSGSAPCGGGSESASCGRHQSPRSGAPRCFSPLLCFRLEGRESLEMSRRSPSTLQAAEISYAMRMGYTTALLTGDETANRRGCSSADQNVSCFTSAGTKRHTVRPPRTLKQTQQPVEPGAALGLRRHSWAPKISVPAPLGSRTTNAGRLCKRGEMLLHRSSQDDEVRRG